MAASSSLLVGISISICIFISLIAPSHSAFTCATQKLPSNRTYTNCTDLPVLGATLHLTYNDTNHSLAVAFAAPPPSAAGWVSWGINPTGGGMVGTQALIAYKLNGTVGVHLYNLTSKRSIDAVKSLSFETWGLAAEESADGITIFAAVKLPEKADNLSQVWQVGPVTSGKPGVHEFKTDNLKAVLPLQVGTTTVEPGSNSTSGGGGNNTTSGDKSGGALVMGERFGLGFYLGLVLVLMGFLTV